MANIPCSRQGLPSCGEMCNKVINECGHKCSRFCHSGPCVDESNPCSDKCGCIRTICGHKCVFSCHSRFFCTEDRPCGEKITLSCKCGHKTLQTVCGAWKEALGRGSGGPINCDDSCQVAERNRKLKEAFDLLPGGPSPSSDTEKESLFSAALRYGEPVVKHAHANQSWVKSIEKTLEEFCKDTSRRSYIFPHAKKINNSFIFKLAPHYNLVPEYVDTHFEGAGAIQIRRKRPYALATVPGILVSEVGAAYRPNLFAQANAAVTAALVAEASTVLPTDPLQEIKNSKGADARTYVNSILLEGLQFGTENRDIQIILEGIFGTAIESKIQWKSDDSCYVVLNHARGTSSGKQNGANLEIELLAVESSLQTKFVGNSFARSVKFCSFSADGGIIMHSPEIPKKNNLEKIIKTSSGNRFNILNNDGIVHEVSKELLQKDEDESEPVDNWEDLDNESQTSEKANAFQF
ncbi:FKBP12-associated protein [Nowakowskiella sp. JEL0078]|nr:FKBP12-associated protein [Nowakowskiella sp. JEL0078]